MSRFDGLRLVSGDASLDLEERKDDMEDRERDRRAAVLAAGAGEREERFDGAL